MDFSIVTCLWELPTEVISAPGRSLIAEPDVRWNVTEKDLQQAFSKGDTNCFGIRIVIAFVLVALFSPIQQSGYAHGSENHAKPVEGFITEEVSAGWNAVMGLRFGPNAADTKTRQYVWEKRGAVFVVEDGQKLYPPLNRHSRGGQETGATMA